MPYSRRRFERIFAAAVFALACAFASSGCAYKTEVRQGAPLPEEKVGQLVTGMTKTEVAALLGPPQSERLFRGDIWLYYHKRRSAGFSPETSVAALEIVFDASGAVAEIRRLAPANGE